MKLSTMQKGSNNVIITDFDSIGELQKHCETAPMNMYVFKVASSGKEEGFGGWAGTRNYNEAEVLLSQGWSEGAKKLTSQLKIENIKNNKEVKRAIFDVVGFQASVPRYLQGVPQSMINKKSVKQKQRVITLYKSIAYSARVRPDQILNDSVKFVQIIQDIEKQGIRVNAYVIWHSIVGGEENVVRIKIKSSSERINISKMSFPLMHPSMLRRIMFRALECNSRLTKTEWNHGYGRPAQGSETKPLMNENEFLIPILISEKDAKSIVEGQLHKQ